MAFTSAASKQLENAMQRMEEQAMHQFMDEVQTKEEQGGTTTDYASVGVPPVPADYESYVAAAVERAGSGRTRWRRRPRWR